MVARDCVVRGLNMRARSDTDGGNAASAGWRWFNAGWRCDVVVNVDCQISRRSAILRSKLGPLWTSNPGLWSFLGTRWR